MAKKQFKAESKRILDLMIHSIYTHKEIFLRELISNASDALDKLYFRSLTDGNVGMARSDYRILIEVDREKRTLCISDNGCGMTQDDLEKNLGVIARSGTLQFKKDNEIGDDIDIIGQFGVGFYSAFMVAKQVTVTSRAFGEETAYCWESTGEDGYTITPCEKAEVGTSITLVIKDDEEEEKYSEYLEAYRLSELIRKYSDYIRYPIQMEMPRSQKVEGSENDWETVHELKTINSMIPVWKKSKSELQEGELERFYQEKFHDFEDPAHIIQTKVEGAVTYTALLFLPQKPPYHYYSKEFQRGLQLYSNGVMIMENCEDLLPEYFGFMRGLVDSSDLSLNISREMLQHDRQLKNIAKNLEKKIKAELLKLQKNEREKYDTFFKGFGLALKYGVYSGFGQNKELLQDLLMFHSQKEGKYVTFQEYVAAMAEGQEFIYYACGETPEQIALLPQLERVREKGYDVLCLTDNVDEFALRMLMEYDGKQFKSVADADLGLESDEEKKALEEKNAQNKEMLDVMKDALDGKVEGVRISDRLKSHAVCLSSEGAISLEMEKVLNEMPTEEKVKATRVLEINANHAVFDALLKLKQDKETLGKYAQMLYAQAMMMEGFKLEDPVAYSNLVCELMAKQA